MFIQINLANGRAHSKYRYQIIKASETKRFLSGFYKNMYYNPTEGDMILKQKE